LKLLIQVNIGQVKSSLKLPKWQNFAQSKAAFLVMCDPSMNEL
jgi:hypothetical protein